MPLSQLAPDPTGSFLNLPHSFHNPAPSLKQLQGIQAHRAPKTYIVNLLFSQRGIGHQRKKVTCTGLLGVLGTPSVLELRTQGLKSLKP
jgi:hypothetical protein